MRTLAQSTLTISLTAALLAGCGGSQPLIGAPAAMSENHMAGQARALQRIRGANSAYQLIYSFSGKPDGTEPKANLINVKGTLYGTTYEGGMRSKGTVFTVSTTGTEHVFYSLGGHRGGHPVASLIDRSGTFYGTTPYGGTYGGGTVFKISASGIERVLFSFGGGHYSSDGNYPDASLIDVDGTLYGTTYYGGTGYGYCLGECGTVFSISANGTETVLHRFTITEGANPAASLINVNGTLYGTTSNDGAYGGGTVFSISTSGALKVLHSFNPRDGDGGAPLAGLIDVNGTLYGTTLGTVFSISTSGNEKVLHRFGGKSDGADAEASLIDVKGRLYGTTAEGGKYGYGTVFSISTSGAEKVLYSFGSGSDGKYPMASLIDVKGTLYGTTESGGTFGYGTVFALTP